MTDLNYCSWSKCIEDGVTIEKTALISKLFVDETMRGNGIGRELMISALEEIKSEGFEKVILWAEDTEIHNTCLSSFYESLGFEETGVGAEMEIIF